MKKILLGCAVVLVLAIGTVMVLAGRAAGPMVTIIQPDQFVGASGELALTVEAPRGEVSELTVVIEQADRRLPVFALSEPGNATVTQETSDRIRVSRRFTRRDMPDLTAGKARLVVTAVRPILFGLQQVATSEARDLEVRFEPPRLAVISTHHYINHGGSEMIVYRVTPPDVDSGVRVGDLAYPGYPASGAGLAKADPSLRVAFFALLYDQDLETPMYAYAKDVAGNEVRTDFDHRVFPKAFRRSRIDLDEGFLGRVVPAIIERSPELGSLVTDRSDLLTPFLKVNGDLRRINGEKVASFAAQTAPVLLWEGTFLRLGGAKTESSFADYRTYFYQGTEVDRQVHLGIDLASTANAPVLAANRGKVLFADYLGIYGNSVIIDHGMGLQSMYAHLSSFAVAAGEEVSKQQEIGRSGQTGLAGGDHLHFAMLLGGHEVNPVEWWDPHWIEDRILRKLNQAIQ